MKKNELIDRITKEARLKRSEAIRAVKALVGSIRATIGQGGKISLSGLGTFKVKSRKARPGRNPKTGETIQIPVGRKISFKPSLALKKLVKTAVYPAIYTSLAKVNPDRHDRSGCDLRLSRLDPIEPKI